jgi:hypothetical protein
LSSSFWFRGRCQHAAERWKIWQCTSSSSVVEQ